MSNAPESPVPERPSRFGRLGGAGFVGQALFVFGMVALIGWRAWKDGGTPQMWSQVLQTLALMTAGIVVSYTAVTAWQGRNARRHQALRFRLQATVLSTGRTVASATALKRLQESGAIPSYPKIAVGLSLAADKAGIALWSGSAKNPQKLLEIPWSKVSAVHATEVAEYGRRSRGVEFLIPADGESISLPFVVTGSGLGGLFPPSSEVIASIASSLEDLRSMSSKP